MSLQCLQEANACHFIKFNCPVHWSLLTLCPATGHSFPRVRRDPTSKLALCLLTEAQPWGQGRRIMTKAVIATETKRDAALEKFSAARVHLGTNGTARQSETLQVFLTAPPGAVSFYTQHIPSLSVGLPQPGSTYLRPGEKRLPLGLQWSHSRRPLLSCAPAALAFHILWGIIVLNP